MTDKQTDKLARSFWETINDKQEDGVLPIMTEEDIRRIYYYMIMLMDEYQGITEEKQEVTFSAQRTQAMAERAGRDFE